MFAAADGDVQKHRLGGANYPIQPFLIISGCEILVATETRAKMESFARLTHD